MLSHDETLAALGLLAAAARVHRLEPELAPLDPAPDILFLKHACSTLRQ